MLDNFVVNFKSILPKTGNSANFKGNRDSLTDSSNDLSGSQTISSRRHRQTVNLLSQFRSYFRRLNDKNLAEVDTLMLPRVIAHPNNECTEWDPVELQAKEKFIEDLDNVLDKFSRAISVSADPHDYTSRRHSTAFNVYKLCSLFQSPHRHFSRRTHSNIKLHHNSNADR